MNEQKEFEEKAKTGFKTQEGFFPAGSAAEQSTPSTKQNNFFGTQNRPNTQGGGEENSKFRKLNGVQGDIINDPSNGLGGEMDLLSKEDLKERLIVAEKVMKSLFQRNKDLEDKAHTEQKTTATTSNWTEQQQCSNC